MKLTVAISTYNRPDELNNCLSALASQVRKDFDILVIDQSEGDASKIICDSYQVIYHKIKGRNISKSRNFALKLATSKYIAFIDDDARPKTDWTSIIYDELIEKNKAGFIGGKVFNLSSGQKRIQFQNGIVSEYGYIEDVRDEDAAKVQDRFRKWYPRPMGTNMVFLKEGLMSIGGFDEFYEYNHDETDVAVRLLRKGAVYNYCDHLIVFHYPAKSVNRPNQFESNWYVSSKNNVYFGLKNGSDNLFIRMLRASKRVFGNEGDFAILTKLLNQHKINLVSFIKGLVSASAGYLVGVWCGCFNSRKLGFKEFQLVR